MKRLNSCLADVYTVCGDLNRVRAHLRSIYRTDYSCIVYVEQSECPVGYCELWGDLSVQAFLGGEKILVSPLYICLIALQSVYRP